MKKSMPDPMTGQEQRRSALIAALKSLTPHMKAVLRQRKAEGRRLRKREDLVWRLLLQSFATMGNSRGWAGLFGNPSLMEQVSFSSLRRWPGAARRLRIEMVFRKAKIRRPAQKAAWLASNFETIKKAGGVGVVTRHALALSTREEKYRFMDAFEGIGPKYARNVWMDLYDPQFRDAVAIDERIKSITATLGYSFRTYDEHERFYQGLAGEAWLEPWELDRLLYEFKEHFLAVIRRGTRRPNGNAYEHPGYAHLEALVHDLQQRLARAETELAALKASRDVALKIAPWGSRARSRDLANGWGGGAE